MFKLTLWFPQNSVPLLGLWPIRTMAASIGTTITTPAQVRFGHNPEAARVEVKIDPLFKVVASVADIVVIGIPVCHFKNIKLSAQLPYCVEIKYRVCYFSPDFSSIGRL